MSIFLNGEDEFEIREILDRRITTLSEIAKSDADMGNFGYVLWRTQGLKKGYSGIWGTRTEHTPYMIIVNDMVAMLVSNLSKLEDSFEYAGWEIDLDSINTYKEEEVIITDISLEDFARLKRFIIDESEEVGWGPSREKVELDCREHDRSNNKLHSVENEKELIETAKYVDEESQKPNFKIRNLTKFHLADLKRHWFARQHKKYNPLNDENMFLFPFDIENYRTDLFRYYNKRNDISGMPMIDVYMPKKYWKNKEGYLITQLYFEEMVDFLQEKGYTDKGIMDNLRSKNGE